MADVDDEKKQIDCKLEEIFLYLGGIEDKIWVNPPEILNFKPLSVFSNLKKLTIDIAEEHVDYKLLPHHQDANKHNEFDYSELSYLHNLEYLDIFGPIKDLNFYLNCLI